MENKRVYILPGELCVSREPTQIDTLLGSCVSVCLYNKRQNFGGMNHFMLPNVLPGEAASGKHGEYAMDTLIQMMLSLDSNKSSLDASVIGGGNVTGHLSLGVGIGAKNIIMARDVLLKYDINVVSKSIGGEYGRKVSFKNWTGEIQIRKIEKSSQTIAIEEKKKDYAARKIKVLIVDDSKTVRSIIRDAISRDPQIEVVGEAENPYQARELILECDPDVICLDIIMPKMDGITFLKKLFLYKPKPVIIISTVAQQGSKLREQAEKIGAIDVIDKEDLKLYAGPDVAMTLLTSKIKAASATWVTKKSKEELDAI